MSEKGSSAKAKEGFKPYMKELESRGEAENMISLLGFFFMVLVIFVHAENLYLIPDLTAANGAYRVLEALEVLISELLGSMAVPGYFFISGYLFCRSFGGERIGIEEIKNKWRSRVFTLVIPYVIWNLIYYIANIAIGEADIKLETLIKAVIEYSYNPVFWYMKQLISLSIFAPFLYLIINGGGVRSGILMLAIVFVLAANYGSVELPVINGDALFYYSCGIFATAHFKAVMENGDHGFYRTAACVSFVLSIVAYFVGVRALSQGSAVILTGATVAFRALLVATVWFIAMAFSIGRIEPRPWMLHTFFTYATHYAVIRLIYRVLPVNVFTLFLSYILMPLICVAVAYASGTLLKRILPLLYAVFSGNRR